MKKDKISVQKAEGFTSKKNLDGSQSDSTESVGTPRTFQDDPCKVLVKVGATLNMGDYNSVRLDVGLSVPCNHAEIDEVFGFAKTWVDDRLNSMIAETKNSN